MENDSAYKLGEIFDEEITSFTSAALKDLFCLGCYLVKIGEKEAGIKACRTAVLAISFSANKTYTNHILSTIEENHEKYASDIRAHTELNALFNKKP